MQPSTTTPWDVRPDLLAHSSVWQALEALIRMGSIQPYLLKEPDARGPQTLCLVDWAAAPAQDLFYISNWAKQMGRRIACCIGTVLAGPSLKGMPESPVAACAPWLAHRLDLWLVTSMVAEAIEPWIADFNGQECSAQEGAP